MVMISSSYICLVQWGQLVELDMNIMREESGWLGVTPLLLSVHILSTESGLEERGAFVIRFGLELDFLRGSGKGDFVMSMGNCSSV